MAKIKIPEDYKAPLIIFTKLDEKKLNIFNDILENISVRESIENIIKRITDGLGIKEREAKEMVELFSSILRVQYVYRIKNEELVQKVYESLTSYEWEDVKLPEDIKERLNRTITSLEILKKRVKSKYLEYYREKIASKFNIISDIRPVFNDISLEDAFGAILLNTLVIDYYENGEMKQLHLALDLEDIKELENTIKRTKLKLETIRKNLKDNLFNIIDIKREA